jgi:hypothetical protein
MFAVNGDVARISVPSALKSWRADEMCLDGKKREKGIVRNRKKGR